MDVIKLYGVCLPSHSLFVQRGRRSWCRQPTERSTTGLAGQGVRWELAEQLCPWNIWVTRTHFKTKNTNGDQIAGMKSERSLRFGFHICLLYAEEMASRGNRLETQHGSCWAGQSWIVCLWRSQRSTVNLAEHCCCGNSLQCKQISGHHVDAGLVCKILIALISPYNMQVKISLNPSVNDYSSLSMQPLSLYSQLTKTGSMKVTYTSCGSF